MKLNTKELLRDKTVLRVMVFFAVVTLLGYVMIKDVNAVVFFILVGFLSTYYSKNMIIVAGIAILATNIMVLLKRNTYYEGLAGLADPGFVERASNIIATSARKNYEWIESSGANGARVARRTADDKTFALKKVKAIPVYEKTKGNNKLVNKAIDDAFGMFNRYSKPPTDDEIHAKMKQNLLNVKTKPVTNVVTNPVTEEFDNEDADSDVEEGLDGEDTGLVSLKEGLDGEDTGLVSLEEGTDSEEIEAFDAESSKKTLSGTRLDGNDADKLMKRQKDLLAQYEKLQPSLERSYKLLNSMGGADGVQGMIEKVGGMIDKFGGLAGKIN